MTKLELFRDVFLAIFLMEEKSEKITNERLAKLVVKSNISAKKFCKTKI